MPSLHLKHYLGQVPIWNNWAVFVNLSPLLPTIRATRGQNSLYSFTHQAHVAPGAFTTPSNVPYLPHVKEFRE